MNKQTLKKTGLFGLVSLFIFLSVSCNLYAQLNADKALSTAEEGITLRPGVREPLTKETPSVGQKDEQKPEYVPAEVLVKFKEGANPQAVLKDANLQSSGLKRVHPIGPVVAGAKKESKIEKDSDGWYWFMGKNYKTVEEVPDEEIFQTAYGRMIPEEKALYRIYKVSLANSENVEAAVKKLSKNPNVEFAQPNYIMRAFMVPNDPYYSSSGTWGQAYDDLWGLKRDKLNCEAGWDMAQGEGIIVAVVDTGVDYRHEDIKDKMWINPNEIPDNGIDDDGNSYIDDVYGIDLANGDSDPMDGHGHGTHCAGTIAATGNNSKGIIGVAPKARIMAVKGLSDVGSGKSSDLALCIQYAADSGAKVISNSWGARMTSDPVVEAAIDYAYALGATVVFAAGNGNEDVIYHSPANYPKTIAVAAIDHNDQRASFSNYGSLVDIAAPGVDILSLRADKTSMGFPINELYTRAQGTSMACPHVAGLAANILSRNPNLTPQEVEATLENNSDLITTDLPTGSGRINVARSLAATTLGNFCHITRVQRIDIDTIQIFAKINMPEFKGLNLQIAPAVSSQGVSIPIPGIIPQNFEFLLATYTANFKETTYVLKLSCTDAAGNQYSEKFSFLVDNFHLDCLENEAGQEIELIGRGLLSIRATMLGSQFISFSIDYGYGKNPTSWETTGISILQTGPCENTVIATLDTSALKEDGYCTVRLNGVYEGFTTKNQKQFYYAKNMHPGWPKTITDDFPTGVYSVDLNGDSLKEVISYDSWWLYVWDEQGNLLNKWRDPDSGGNSVCPLSFAEIDTKPGAEIVYSYTTYIPYTDFYDTKISIASFENNTVQVLEGWPKAVRIDDRKCGDLNVIIVDELQGNNTKNIIFVAKKNLRGTPPSPLLDKFKLFMFKTDGTELNPSQPIIYERMNNNPLGKWRHLLVCLDLNNDGIKEIIVANYEDTASTKILRLDAWGANGTAYRQDNWPVIIPADWPVSTKNRPIVEIATADMNNDREREIVFITGGGFVGILNKKGQFLYNTPKQYSNIITVNDAVEYRSMSLMDIEKDGYVEIVSSAASECDQGELHLLDYKGDERAGWPIKLSTFYPSPGNSLKRFLDTSIGDVNADGNNDIIVTAQLWDFSKEKQPHKLLLAFDTLGNKILERKLFGMDHWVASYDLGARLFEIDNDGKLEMLFIDDPGEYTSRSIISIWDLDTEDNALSREWPMASHDLQHTGGYVPFNRAPVLNPIPNKTINVDQALSFMISGSDSDGDPLAYSASNLPSGASFDASTRIFSWRPTSAQVGTYQVTFTVSDGQLQDSKIITITVINNAAPAVVSLSPGSGTFKTNTMYTLTAVYSDLNGYADIKSADLFIDAIPGASSFHVQYRRDQNLFFFYNGDKLVVGYPPGSASVVETPYGKLDCSQTTASGSGYNLTVKWRVSFKPVISGTKKVYLSSTDMSNASSGMVQKGTFKINSLPTVVSLSPSSGTFKTNTVYAFTTVYSDLDGYANIKSANLFLNTNSTTTGAFYVQYRRDLNKLYLYNNSVITGGYAPGSANIIETPYGKLDCRQTMVLSSGSNLTISWKVNFNSTMSGIKNAYMSCGDMYGGSSGTVKKGTITISN